MKTYFIEYTADLGDTHKVILISAEDYTKAYISATMTLPNDIIITTVFEI